MSKQYVILSGISAAYFNETRFQVEETVAQSYVNESQSIVAIGYSNLDNFTSVAYVNVPVKNSSTTNIPVFTQSSVANNSVKITSSSVYDNITSSCAVNTLNNASSNNSIGSITNNSQIYNLVNLTVSSNITQITSNEILNVLINVNVNNNISNIISSETSKVTVTATSTTDIGAILSLSYINVLNNSTLNGYLYNISITPAGSDVPSEIQTIVNTNNNNSFDNFVSFSNTNVTTTIKNKVVFSPSDMTSWFTSRVVPVPIGSVSQTSSSKVINNLYAQKTPSFDNLTLSQSTSTINNVTVQSNLANFTSQSYVKQIVTASNTNTIQNISSNAIGKVTVNSATSSTSTDNFTSTALAKINDSINVNNNLLNITSSNTTNNVISAQSYNTLDNLYLSSASKAVTGLNILIDINPIVSTELSQTIVTCSLVKSIDNFSSSIAQKSIVASYTNVNTDAISSSAIVNNNIKIKNKVVFSPSDMTSWFKSRIVPVPVGEFTQSATVNCINSLHVQTNVLPLSSSSTVNTFINVNSYNSFDNVLNIASGQVVSKVASNSLIPEFNNSNIICSTLVKTNNILSNIENITQTAYIYQAKLYFSNSTSTSSLDVNLSKITPVKADLNSNSYHTLLIYRIRQISSDTVSDSSIFTTTSKTALATGTFSSTGIMNVYSSVKKVLSINVVAQSQVSAQLAYLYSQIPGNMIISINGYNISTEIYGYTNKLNVSGYNITTEITGNKIGTTVNGYYITEKETCLA